MPSKTNSKSNLTSLPAIGACLLAALLWGVLWYPLRIMESMGLPGLWATLTIYLPATLVVVSIAVIRRVQMPANQHLFVYLALIAGWTNLSFILALLEGTVVRVLLLFYLSPVWTLLLARWLLREPISNVSLLHLVLAFSGAIILLWTDEFDLLFSKADWLAISSGFGFALTNVIVRKIGDVPIVYKMSSAFLGVIVLSFIGLLLSASPVPQPEPSAIVWGVVVGLIGMILMTYAAQYGVTHLPLHQSATLFLFEVPAGAISAAWLSEEIMSNREWIGGLLVMIAAWLSARSTIKHSRNTQN